MPVRRLTLAVLLIAVLAATAAGVPFVNTAGPGPWQHVSVRGEPVEVYGIGPYRHMPADVAVQGLAQDLVTLAAGIPFLLFAWWWARRGSRAGHVALCGAVAYLFVQYFMYLGMGTYNELFLVYVLLVGLTFLALTRLLLAVPTANFAVNLPAARRRFVGVFLLVNGTLVALLWLSVVVPPLLAGTLYPADLANFTTLIVQGFDLALFLPPSLLAGYWYLKQRPAGELLAPVYVVFLSLQMVALLAKIVWMAARGVSAGPALVLIPLLLLGAIMAAFFALSALAAPPKRDPSVTA
ncbi:hypothetical protein BHE97_19700 [Aeromicrobium sp. PE09-221]|nr:hypothetical protein BHE97_19700 [Aeromicrobium sp. PE09-221]